MKSVRIQIVGVGVMDKKDRHFMDHLEDHTVEKTTKEMDEKLNEAKRKMKDF